MTKRKIHIICIGWIIAAIVSAIAAALVVLLIPRSLEIKNLTADINISKLSVSPAGDFLTETKEADKNSETAKKILEKDADLSAPEHGALRLEVLRLFRRSGENGRN